LVSEHEIISKMDFPVQIIKLCNQQLPVTEFYNLNWKIHF